MLLVFITLSVAMFLVLIVLGACHVLSARHAFGVLNSYCALGAHCAFSSRHAFGACNSWCCCALGVLEF